ncbi:MAG: hypothetical protein K2P57_07960 [Burkholderiales bacterium]|nr:hypothetical protein [Burkholderiales bacterium]
MLAAGNSVELVNSSSPNLRVNITAPAGDATNVGTLVAQSGNLGLFGALVKNSGTVNADSATVQGGTIVFKAASRAEVSGSVSARGTSGGTIEVLGNQVGIMDGAKLDASGASGGGTILVGGDKQGLNPAVQNAQVTYVDPTATISADATQNGNGGKVIVWADNTTRSYGSISARGGALSGNGGFVETSGKKVLDVTNAPDVFAPKGTSGSWLLDPETINITTGANANITAASPFTPAAAGTSTLNNATIVTALNAGGTVTIDTTGGGAGVGDINVNATIVPTTALASTLNFKAHGNINVNAGIGSNNGVLNMNFTPGQAGAVGAKTVVAANMGGNGGGTWTFNTASDIAGISLIGNAASVGTTIIVNPLGATMNFKSAILSAVTLNNSGTINQTANAALTSANVLLGSGTIFNNLAGATLNLNSPFAGSVMYANTAATINNSGTINQVSANFTGIYSGQITPNVLTGILTFNEAASGVLNGVGAQVRVAAATTLTGSLTLQGSGMELVGNAASATNITTSAPTTVTGPLTLTAQGIGTVTLNATAGALTNQGSITVSGAATISGVLNNQGTLTFGTASGLVAPTFGDINNTGTITSTVSTTPLNLTGSYTQSGAGTITATAGGFTLNANQDITFNNALTKPAGSGLWTFAAKRSVALNSSVTTNNTSFTAVANSSGTNNNGTATPATMTLGSGASITAGTGTVNLAVTGGNFINNSGSTTPITAANTRIYSTDPRLNNVAGMAAQSRLYSCTYAAGCGVGVTIPATNTVYLYSIANPNLALTVTATAASKVYGAVDPTLAYTVVGLVGGDTAASVLTGAVTRVAGENVGAYAINQGTLATNAYILGYVSNPLTITAAPLTVTANAATKVYGTADPALTYTATGFKFTDTTAVLTGAQARAAGANVGTYAINQGTLAASNYAITYNGNNLTITPAALTVTGTVANPKVYDGTTTASLTGGSLVGAVAGDVLTLTQAGSFASKNVGTNIVVTAADVLGGAAAGNYTLTQPAPLAANITPATLTVTANNASKTYNTANPVLGVSYAGFVNGETAAVLTTQATASTTAVTASPVGTYPITPAGATASNYTVNYANGTLSVTPLVLTVLTVNNTVANNKVYDGTTTATLTGGTLVGVAPGDVVTLNQSGIFATQNVGVNIPVTATDTLGGLNAPNYTLTQPTGLTASITARPVNLTGSRVYDGTTTVLSSIFTASNLVAGETLTLSGAGSIAAKGVTAGTAVTPGTLALGNGSGLASNYTFTGGTQTAAITPAALTVSATGTNRVYNGLTADAVTLSDNRIAGDALTLANAAANFADKNVGVGKAVSVTGITVTGTDAANYTFNTTANTSANITPAALTVTATGTNRVYNGLTSDTVTLADNRVAGDVLALTNAAANFADKNVGVGKAVSVTGISVTGTDAANYTFNTTANTSANITAANLTVTGTIANNKVYDGTTAATLTGGVLVGALAGDVVTLTQVGTFATKNVGAAIVVSAADTLGGAAAGNYTLTQPTPLAANITVAPLTVTANNAAKTYGATQVFAGTEFTQTGLVGGETIGSVTLASAGAAPTATVAGGPYAITPSAATGGTFLASNYAVTYANGSLTVNPAALTVTGTTVANKVYDGTTTATLSGGALVGAVNGDVLSLTQAGTFASKNVGTGIAVTAADIVGGAAAGNYTLTQPAPLAANITAAPLTVTANNAAKTYGVSQTFVGTAFTQTGLVGGETIGSVTLASSGAAPTATVAGGPYAITPSAATGGTFVASNYAVTYVNGALTVNAAPLTVTANNATKTYGATQTFLGTAFTSTGLLNGETIGTVTLVSPGAAPTATVAGGPYAIVPSAATGGTFVASNYAVTYANGALTVNAAPLTVTANNALKTYNGLAYNGGNGVAYAGLVNAETSAVLGGVLTYGGTSQGAINAGSYIISPGGLTSANYAITYASGALTVAPAPLTVTANAATKVYGSADPVFSYTATGLQLADTAATVLTGVQVRAAGENVGVYAINQGSLASNANYTIAYTINNLGITPAALTVAANAATKVAGAVDPLLSYTATGLKFADTPALVLTGGLVRVTGEAAGTYAINQGTLLANANYALNFVPANFDITAAPVVASGMPPNLVNTILIPGNSAVGSSHSTIVVEHGSASNVPVINVASANNVGSGTVQPIPEARLCRATAMSGKALQSLPACF